MVESKTGFVIGRVVIFSLFPFFQTFYIWRRERSGWISSIDRKMIIVIFFFIYLYIYFLLFYSASFPHFSSRPFSKGEKKELFFTSWNCQITRFLSIPFFQRPPPPSISRFETHNDNFLSPYSFSFGSVSNLSVSPRPVRLNSAFGSDVPLLIEENQDMTHTQ
jgi:hypothetical protein